MAILGATAFWLTLLGGLVLLVLLTGCILEQQTRGDAGKFNVTVDCEEGANVDVSLDLDRDEAKQKAEGSGIPAVP